MQGCRDACESLMDADASALFSQKRRSVRRVSEVRLEEEQRSTERTRGIVRVGLTTPTPPHDGASLPSELHSKGSFTKATNNTRKKRKGPRVENVEFPLRKC